MREKMTCLFKRSMAYEMWNVISEVPYWVDKGHRWSSKLESKGRSSSLPRSLPRLVCLGFK